MRTRWRIAIALGLVLATLVPLVVGICGRLNNLGDKKDDHVIALPGNSPLTDEQALALARQVLTLDQRDVSNLAVDVEGGAGITTRPSDNTLTIHYRDVKTRWDWFVELEREDGKVIGSSYHGL